MADELEQIDEEAIGKYAEVLEAVWDKGGDIFGLADKWVDRDSLKRQKPSAFRDTARQLYDSETIEFFVKDGASLGKSKKFKIDELDEKFRQYALSSDSGGSAEGT